MAHDPGCVPKYNRANHDTVASRIVRHHFDISTSSDEYSCNVDETVATLLQSLTWK